MTISAMPRLRQTVTTLSGAQDQLESGFFKLAAELRNKIYELALDGARVQVESKTTNNPHGLSRVPGILMACKHVYAEALILFFESTTFSFSSKARLHQWLGNIGEANRAMIEHVEFRVPWNRGSEFVIGHEMAAVEEVLRKRGMFYVGRGVSGIILRSLAYQC